MQVERSDTCKAPLIIFRGDTMKVFIWVIFMVVLSVAHVISIVYRACKKHEKTYMQMWFSVFISAALLIIWLLSFFVWDNLFVPTAFIAIYVLSLISAFIDFKEYELSQQKLPKDVKTYVSDLHESKE